ncbi:cupin domain-containing protein [Paraferrimonas haliotis]|nr:cupin domain-containing protein [Paraferrimonas haliotis]
MTLRINANFKQRVVIRPDDYQWLDSPMPGVQRMMLDRIGDEVARATSLVRYQPHSEFSAHQHNGGEEILVLAGEFADEHGSYGPGYYLRNPIGTKHKPQIGAAGATILVKLHQFDDKDVSQLAIDSYNQAFRPGLVEGLSVLSLHQFESEQVALVRWAPNTQFSAHKHWGGEEIFVIEGTFYDEWGEYPAGSWIRSPHLSQHKPFTKQDGALLFVKVGHLAVE